MKMWDLVGVQVHRYKHNSQQYLIAYTYIDGEFLLTFIGYGTHENFYRDLKYWAELVTSDISISGGG